MEPITYDNWNWKNKQGAVGANFHVLSNDYIVIVQVHTTRALNTTGEWTTLFSQPLVLEDYRPNQTTAVISPIWDDTLFRVTKDGEIQYSTKSVKPETSNVIATIIYPLKAKII